jgi:hypothetical protein
MKRVSALIVSALLLQFLVVVIPSAVGATSLRITSARVEGLTASISWTSQKLGSKEFFEIQIDKLSVEGTADVKFKSIKTKEISISTKLDPFTSYAIRVRKTLSPKKWTAFRYISVTSNPISNLQATNTTYTSTNLNWDPVLGATGYEVNVNGSTKTVVPSRLVLEGLDASTSYDVTVRAIGNGKRGVESEILKIETASLGPKNLVASNITKISTDLNWLSISGADGYNVYQNGNLIGTTKLSRFTVSALTPGSKSEFSVAAIFGKSMSFQSNKIEVSSLSYTPAIPTLSVITSQGVTVSWSNDPIATMYTVNVYDSLGTNLIKSNKVSAGLSSTTFTGLSSLTNYTIGVTSNYPGVSSNESSLATFMTLKPTVSAVLATNITATTATISWSPLTFATSYETNRNGLGIATAISSSATSYTFSNLTPGETYRLGVRGVFLDSSKVTSYTEFAEVLVTTTTDASFKPVISTLPVVTLPYANTPVIGASITVSNGTWTSTPVITSYSYQWQRSLDDGSTWSDLSGATNPSYIVNVSDNSFLLRAKVTASNPNGIGVAYSLETSEVSALYNKQVPIIRGSAVVGEMMELSEGVWSSPYPITLTYRWFSSRTGSESPLSFSPTYVVGESEVGYEIYAQVTASTTHGYLAVNSPPRGLVTIVGNTVRPTITGTLRVGGTLSVSDGTWLNSSGSAITYQWQSSSDKLLWDSILGATDSTYTLNLAETGLYIRAQVFNTKSGFTVIANSLATAVVPGSNLVNTVAPEVKGDWSVGIRLIATSGTWSLKGTIAYQWQSSVDDSAWSDIVGAVSSSYTLTETENSKFVRVQVTNSTTSGTGLAYSASRSKVGSPFNTKLPAITGVLRVGSTLTATSGSWANTPVTYLYQWQKSADGIFWINLLDETLETYIPTFDVANLQVRVRVTAENAIGSSFIPSSVVQKFLPPQATAIPTVSGQTIVGQILSTSNGDWPGTVSGFVYQWQRSSNAGLTWTNISGARASSYTILAADAGYVIRAQVSLTTNAGSSAAYSLATASVS